MRGNFFTVETKILSKSFPSHSDFVNQCSLGLSRVMQGQNPLESIWAAAWFIAH